MTPEQDKIFGKFSECPLAPLEVVPTYEYMTNLNVYLNSYLSGVDCMLGCGTLGYLVLTAQPAVFNTKCGTEFVTPKKSGHSSGHARPSSNGHNFVRTCQNTQSQSSSM